MTHRAGAPCLHEDASKPNCGQASTREPQSTTTLTEAPA
jgi:hypothetical protein